MPSERSLTESLQKVGHQIRESGFRRIFPNCPENAGHCVRLAKTDLDGWALALHHLPEPERSAITLFYLEIFSPTRPSGTFWASILTTWPG